MSPLNLPFKALSDPTRREILRLLAKGDLTAGEIADRFAITKPSISHHLNLLKQAGLVTDERRGQNIVYSLNTTVFQDVLGWVMNVLEGGKPHSGGKDDDTH
ncbi:MAG TPA: winged helix-turn-helix transcriptional regulator [Firmicutes bacterium]|nr:winged helix-turn-helix transcriptional regulator [Bacillota bacterium]